ncbi:MAG: transposase, partial [Pseudomonadota bacterium]
LFFDGVWPYHASRDLEPGHGRRLRYGGAPQPSMPSSTGRFLMCYGPEFIAEKVRDWIAAVGASTAFIEPGSPWGENVKRSIRWIDRRSNGYCEALNARFRDELLNSEIFFSLREAKILIEQWRNHYNTVRPHSALGYRPPAPETIIPVYHRPVMH